MEQDYSEKNHAEEIVSGLGSPESGFLQGVSLSMKPVESVLRELAQSKAPVLLLGEPGSGKRMIAGRIHSMASAEGSFRVAECSALRPDSFTGQSRELLLREGTLYLRELSELSKDCQERLLHSLQSHGANGNSGMHARLVCGTVHDLESEVRSHRFREDLYYRISGVCLRLPPLRQRREDISYLTNFFLSRYAQDFRRPVPKLSAESERLFQEYSWPGNVRELENTAKAIVALGSEAIVLAGLRALLRKPEGPGKAELVSLKQAARAASREAEKEMILKVLTRTRWNRRRAAEELQISYKALLYKLKQIGYDEYGGS
jgi:two-component system, NtrC family, response regulator AtoC